MTTIITDVYKGRLSCKSSSIKNRVERTINSNPFNITFTYDSVAFAEANEVLIASRIASLLSGAIPIEARIGVSNSSICQNVAVALGVAGSSLYDIAIDKIEYDMGGLNMWRRARQVEELSGSDVYHRMSYTKGVLDIQFSFISGHMVYNSNFGESSAWAIKEAIYDYFWTTGPSLTNHDIRSRILKHFGMDDTRFHVFKLDDVKIQDKYDIDGDHHLVSQGLKDKIKYRNETPYYH